MTTDRTVLCRTCLTFLTAPKRDVLLVMRDHALDEHHHIAELVCIDVDLTAQRLISEALSHKARR